MPTIAIIGAGPGLGLSLATTFGRHGYSAALIARNPAKLDALVAELTSHGIPAAGFVADTSDHAALADALAQARAHFGSVDVLEFSPYAAGPGSMVSPTDVTVENLRPVLDTMLLGAVAAVQAVLPAMVDAGHGTIVFTAGSGSIHPVPFFGTLNTAQAATRNWALNLHGQLVGSGVHVAHVAIGVSIGEAAPAEGYPFKTPDEIAAAYWDLHAERSAAELVIS
ncbi:SDR family NAD(P)-dependent oxidoreductase [Herbiconiux liukaitaii]|uniref:SDR family NAD(P)-dependent oxidoreductase n=1 Tax=Herbiconiux liukaitaii TaxID=3342799 RepID=UPI0035BA62A1